MSLKIEEAVSPKYEGSSISQIRDSISPKIVKTVSPKYEDSSISQIRDSISPIGDTISIPAESVFTIVGDSISPIYST